MYLYNDKKQLHQWDLNQKVIVVNELIKEVHFTNASLGKALVVEVVDGTANIPNILLQEAWDIKAYGYCGECVRESLVINVIPRAKPEDYVYTETEIKTWDSLKEELEAEIDEQIEAGIEEIKSQSVVSDMYSNALRGAAAGNAVALDVSPVEHTLEVKARSKNMFDAQNAVRVNGVAPITSQSKDSITVSTHNTSNWQSANIALPETLIGCNVTISGEWQVSGSNKGGLRLNWVDSNGGVVGAIIAYATESGKAVTGTISAKPNGAYHLALMLYANADGTANGGDTVTYNNVQLEIGTGTPYTPYVEDVTAASVQKYGENILNQDNPTGPSIFWEKQGEYWVGTNANYADLSWGAYRVAKGQTITVSFDCDSVGKGSRCIITKDKPNAVGVRLIVSQLGRNIISYTATEDMNVFINFMDFGADGVYKIKNIMLCYGTNAEYEPYQEPVTYPIAADGTVENVTSIYPTTTLITDTPGVVIDVNYNKDINKAFEELTQAIISLGGNV